MYRVHRLVNFVKYRFPKIVVYRNILNQILELCYLKQLYKMKRTNQCNMLLKISLLKKKEITNLVGALVYKHK